MRFTTLLSRLSLAVALGSVLATTGAIAKSESPWVSTKAGEPVPKLNIPKQLAKNLATFDELDFIVYSQQDWKNLHKSHANNIIVHYPDGHTTIGIPAHIAELDWMWTFAPDNRIEEHPVRFGTADAEWTAVIGALEGTFTKPMVLPNGTRVEPNGRKYKLPMATIGHWNKQGQMDTEYLFWDNADLMKQLGISE